MDMANRVGEDLGRWVEEGRRGAAVIQEGGG